MHVGTFPDKGNPQHKDDPDGPFFKDHLENFQTALQRALDSCPPGLLPDQPISFSADVIKTNPGGIREYKAKIGA
jgi:hypothetical protein